MSLNHAQVKAATDCGIRLVLAGPGSGKTRVITGKVHPADPLKKYLIPPQDRLHQKFCWVSSGKKGDARGSSHTLSTVLIHSPLADLTELREASRFRISLISR